MLKLKMQAAGLLIRQSALPILPRVASVFLDVKLVSELDGSF